MENGDQFDGAVIDENDHIDVYTNVDYFIGTGADDTFVGGSGSDQFNAMWSDGDGDTFDGGDGDDTLIIEDSISNRGIFGDLSDAAVGVGVNSIDLNSIEVIKNEITGIFNVTGTNVSTDDNKDIDVELTDVERIDIREYVESEELHLVLNNAELYVVDSYELLEGGQGDLGDMYYVTSLSHSTFDIHDGETPTYQILAEDTLYMMLIFTTAVIIRTLIAHKMQVYGLRLVQQQLLILLPIIMKLGKVMNPYSSLGMTPDADGAAGLLR